MTVIVNNTGFSVEYWARFGEQEFIEQAIRQRIFKDVEESDRILLLKQVHKLLQDHPARTTKKA